MFLVFSSLCVSKCNKLLPPTFRHILFDGCSVEVEMPQAIRDLATICVCRSARQNENYVEDVMFHQNRSAVEKGGGGQKYFSKSDGTVFIFDY